MSRTILITGGMGFIGSNLVRYWRAHHPKDKLVILDALTYAARPEYIKDFIDSGEIIAPAKCDLRDREAVRVFLETYKPTDVIHLAAESHVCRSISGPEAFFSTNVMGTFNLIEECRRLWAGEKGHRFHHVSTDEVFGQLNIGDQPFRETSPLLPTSPYASSKASSDLLVLSYFRTYGMNVVLTNCTNNYGPNQHEEKLIPKAIKSLLTRDVMTVYGLGSQVRDWIYVVDHCAAIDLVFHESPAGERYCVGGECELTNMDVMDSVRLAVGAVTGQAHALKYVHTDDRPTDDFRYAVSNDKIRRLGWVPRHDCAIMFQDTVQWYLANTDWRTG